MSFNWPADMAEMHSHYGVHDVVDEFGPEKLRALLKFRVDFLKEELRELEENVGDPEEVVDALVDLCVVAIGTLDLFGVNPHEAWDVVLEANMAKEVGVKPERPNPLGLPDLVKPAGWKAPSHEGNHGRLAELVDIVQELNTEWANDR
jgi:hypothetical protein